VCKTLPRTRFSALLRCDFALRSESAGCSRIHTPPDFVFLARTPFMSFAELSFSDEAKRMALRHDARRGPPKETKSGREVSARAADGLKAQCKIEASAVRASGGQYSVRTPEQRIDLAQRFRPKRAAGNTP
jgi:hypothetical protein